MSWSQSIYQKFLIKLYGERFEALVQYICKKKTPIVKIGDTGATDN